MAEFVFTSPGVKFRERNLTYVTQSVGITTLGLVGETLKGPAFEPVYVEDKLQFQKRFGNQSITKFNNGNLKYQLPYVANAYLEESNQLWVTRVLGLSGYDAGNAWALKISAGLDPSTIGSVSVGAPTNVNFTGNTYNGIAITSTGQTATNTVIVKSGTTFNGTKTAFTVTSFTGDTGGVVSVTATTFTAQSYSSYEGMVVSLIRSRATVQPVVNGVSETKFVSDNVEIIGEAVKTDIYANFNLVAKLTGTTAATYTVSLNPQSTSFISNSIGSEPKDKNTKLWVEAIYPELIAYLKNNGSDYSISVDAAGLGLTGVSPYIYGLSTTPITVASGATSNVAYKTQFKTPETPWVVSEVKGGIVDKLFKFISISDGNSANQEIKISIENINIATKEFDVIIRDFNDTDANKVILEAYTRCTLIPSNNNYIARRIGTSDGNYDLVSKYVMVEMAENVSVTSHPAGFEGYMLNSYSGGLTPAMIYKTKYEDNESSRLSKYYLGISSSIFNNTGINQNLFNFNGYWNDQPQSSGFAQSKGFHLDNNADVNVFEVGAGAFQTIDDVTEPTSPYNNIKSRKFTFVPAGGFDGWDVNNDIRTYGNEYALNGIYDGVLPNGNPVNDFQAYEMGINTFGNPEAVTINLFATPGINWSDNNTLVVNTIEMLEEQRTDCLYIVDAPNVEVSYSVGQSKPDVIVAETVAEMLDSADLDSTYACTYYPWIQYKDVQNNVNVFLPPTGEVVKAMAYNDKVKAPWYAPAGLNRGVTDAKKSRYKLSQEARDVLYKARINPLIDFAEVGTAIFGQKTLEVAETALNSINVRRLLLQAKVLISNVAIRLVFEPNDQTTIDEFMNKVNPILETIKRERGLYEFAVKMDDTLNTPETIDRGELYGEIYIKPTRAVEKIGIEFTITNTGASFNEL